MDELGSFNGDGDGDDAFDDDALDNANPSSIPICGISFWRYDMAWSQLESMREYCPATTQNAIYKTKRAVC